MKRRTFLKMFGVPVGTVAGVVGTKTMETEPVYDENDMGQSLHLGINPEITGNNNELAISLYKNSVELRFDNKGNLWKTIDGKNPKYIG